MTFTAEVSYDVATLAAHLQECGGDFKTNTAHARFAGKLSTTLDRQYRGAFVLAAMPAWMVGTSKSNVWERIARHVSQREAVAS